MQPFREVLIFAGVADETRIELDRRHCADESFHLHDERIWHTGVAQEDLRNLCLGFVDGVDPNGGWSIVCNRFEPVHMAQIVVCEDGLYNLTFAEVRLGEVRPAEVRPAEVRLAEVRPAEVRPVEARPAEVRLAEVRPAEVRIAEDRIVEVRSAEVRPAEVRIAEDRLTEVRPAEVRLAE